MNVCVLGLWHLGTVTAASLASAGHQVVGLDFDVDVVEKLTRGIPPLFEPGLEDLVSSGLSQGKLQFTNDTAEAVPRAEVLWCTFDTPVDENDNAQTDWVIDRLARTFPFLSDGMLVLISSQLSVGSTCLLEKLYAEQYPDTKVTFGYSPENLRLGAAIRVFTSPDRVVVGLRDNRDRDRVRVLLGSFTDRIEWMSVESAEMTKHALNAFLAASVTFANEIAILCEQVGADAKEVERGLKSDVRIGPKAYLAPGAAFAGGTLARDIRFLNTLGANHHLPTPVLAGIEISNQQHKSWAQRKLLEVFGDLHDKTIAVWGLTYKAGTDTLRRSLAIELCRWLTQQGTTVNAHDPAVKTLPSDLAVRLCLSPLEALQNADAVVLATSWPIYKELSGADVYEQAPNLTIVDPSRFLEKTLGSDSLFRYVTVGKPL